MQNHIRSTVKYIKKKRQKNVRIFPMQNHNETKKKKHNNIYTNPTKSVALHGEKKQSSINC
jgi:hypothetical protein